MARNHSLTSSYGALPWVLRLIIQIVFGVLVGGIYRIVRFVESKNIITLIAGIIALVTGIGNLIAWVVDLVTLIINGKYTVLVD